MKPTTYYTGITGIIQRIAPIRSECCNQVVSIRTLDGMINFVLSPGTYVADNTPLRTGMRITAFYDTSQPVPLIYPPQYQAAFIARTEPGENVMVAYFNEQLLSTENQLQLNISPDTRIATANGQRFTCSIGNQLLMVYYGATTRSIPPQASPERIIVFC